MNEKITLRKKIEDTKADHLRRYGELNWKYTDEGLPYAIQDYHGSVGSVLDFTEDDWLACKENGWTMNEVLELCDEKEFSSDVDSLEQFFSGFPTDMPKEDAIAAVEDFYTWRNDLLNEEKKIYANS